MSINTQSSVGFFHTPVLVDEVVDYLITNPGGIYVDCTVGGGGHAEALLGRLNKKATYFGIDRDDDAISYAQKRLYAFRDKLVLIHGEFGNVDTILNDQKVSQVNGILMDLGISSYQIDTPERGFSYRHNGPLDMRMDRTKEMTAEYVINNYSEQRLADVFYYYGEERYSRKIAGVIGKSRRKKSIRTTADLENIIREITPQKYQVKVLARIWQSLRAEVNNEYEQLKNALSKMYPFLKSGARVVVITWESLSDRMVKRYFKGQTLQIHRNSEVSQDTGFNFEILTKKVIRPCRAEIDQNPRAKSAKMRVGIKLNNLRG